MVIERQVIRTEPDSARAGSGEAGHRERLRRFAKYALCSGLAAGASAVTFAVAYRYLGSGPRVASVTAFAAGAVVNFAGNRFWAWNRRQRLGLGRDLTGYLVLAVTTALAAAGVTSLAHAYAQHVGMSADRRAVFVEAAYFATYAAMFLVKFLLLDQVLFRSSRHQVPNTTRA